MDERAKEVWGEVLKHDVLIPPTETEIADIRARRLDLMDRALTWQGSDGKVAMPTIGEMCALAADLAKLNVRSALHDLQQGREPRSTVSTAGLREARPWGLG